jgi:hypothetical protein
MIEILIAIAWFTVLAGVANVLQTFFGITYQKNVVVFVSLFLSGVAGMWLTTSLSQNPSFLNPVGVLIGIAAFVSYVLVCIWWGRQYTLDDMYGVETLSESYYQLLKPNLNSSFSKAGEVLVQDVTMLLVVTQLLVMDVSHLLAGLLFAVVVFLVHIPAPLIIGRVYGVWLTVLATSFALFIPLVIDTFIYGFYFVFAFHLFIYILLLVASRLMQKWST